MQTPYSRDLYIAANHTSYQFIRRYSLGKDDYDVFSEPELDFLWLLHNRVLYTRTKPRVYEKQGTCEFELIKGENPQAKVSVYLPEDSSQVELFSFSVNKKGGVNGANEYYPIHVLSGVDSKQYVVDISGLFYTDLGEVTLPRSEEKSDRGETEIEVIQKEGSGAFLRYRMPSDKSGQELAVQCKPKAK